jgi:hypothetical protein
MWRLFSLHVFSCIVGKGIVFVLLLLVVFFSRAYEDAMPIHSCLFTTARQFPTPIYDFFNDYFYDFFLKEQDKSVYLTGGS